jgi:hypothetical protein
MSDRTYSVRNYADNSSTDDAGDEFSTMLSGVSWEAARWYVDYNTTDDNRGELVIHAEDAPLPLVVCVVLWDRAYGGPEEGGWWYDTYDPNDFEARWLTHELGGPGVYNDRERAEECRKLLQLMLDSRKVNEGRHSPNSVLSQGHYEVHIYEGWPRVLPEITPHYE